VTTAGTASERGFFARGGAWVLGQSVSMPLVLLLGPLTPGAATVPWLSGLALVLLILGAGFGLAGAWVLGRNRTIFPKPNDGSQLICHGVYRLVRHPLYTSVTLLSLAWAAWWISWVTLAVALSQAVFLDLKSRREEAWLRDRFPGYADYARRVRRFLPWLY
jgi:protein-S-isoprenylcysteine O-methyltransferase Ste14